jgi:hypothetical protein
MPAEDSEPSMRPLGAEIMFFFLIGAPIAFSFFGFPNFFVGFLALVHEMGHFIVMLADAVILPGDNTFLMVLAGGFFECAIPLASFLAVCRDRRLFVVACLFLAATGTALIDNGRYMSSAQNPYGTAYISGRPMTSDIHDWSRIFGQLGILEDAGDISEGFMVFGRLLQYLGFYSALAAFFAYDLKKPRTRVLLYGIGLSFSHAVATQDSPVMLLLVFASALAFVYERFY